MRALNTPCDLCGETDFEMLYPGNLRMDIEPALYFSSSRLYAGHWPVVRCRNCRLVQSQPHDDEHTLNDVYQHLADENYHAEEDNRIRVATERVRILRRWMPNGRLLDVGCAGGFFTAQAGQNGWQVYGLEPSQWALQSAQKRWPQGEYVRSSLQEAHFPAHSFDLITLWDVLEHVPHPGKALAQLTPWLKPGGWLALNIPNVESLPARLMGRHWVLLLREHLWYFSPGTIRRYLHALDYEVPVIQPNWVRFSLGNIFTRLAQYNGLGFTTRLAALPGIQRLSLRFPMGEMMVLAKKH
ncbi:MAG: hypothetical protein CVU39_11595 [Chloroflexi bacterium HGW-Chloroflexi-10]|nr:MAG: hypothetical protein CVU39_11595 [Chloroflexi bacterium HGW-Chloroflexi-10]